MDLSGGKCEISTDFLFDVIFLYRFANCNGDIINSDSFINKHK
jgi:hypothetical protein